MRDWRIEPLERIAEIRSSNVDKKSNPGEEPVRHCPCHNTMSFDAPQPVRYEGAPMPGAFLWVERVEHGADGHEHTVERPPSA